ncbi:MAG: hypothetical protein Q8P67_22390, partial [archaeon]|nr:hypothetical protein [archaeon]
MAFGIFLNEMIDKTDIYEEIEKGKTNICERASLDRCSVGVSNQEVKRTSHVPGPQKTRLCSPNDWFAAPIGSPFLPTQNIKID